MLNRFLRAKPAPPVAVASTAIANAVFGPYDRDFWLLYELCRYHSLICTARVVEAARTDNGANSWLLVSAVGAGCAGTIKLLTGLNTDAVWEAATLVSVGLAVLALMRRAPEIKYVVFGSIGVFDGLASRVRQAAIQFRAAGTDADITRVYTAIYTEFSAELQKLGPDHTSYEAANKRRLGRQLKQVLSDEGRIRP
jgi:hypothetical protein